MSLENNLLNESTSNLSCKICHAFIFSSINICFSSFVTIYIFLPFVGLCKLTRLVSLNLGKNQLNSIPPCLEHQSSLIVLRLQGNKFRTPLAIQGINLFSCITIYLLWIMGLKLVFIISSYAGLCELPKVEVLDLHSNQLLDGSIPPCLTNLTQLTYLDLSNNRFGGEVPFNVLRHLNSLQHVDLSNSQFNGVFPFSILENHVNLSFVDLSSNHQLKVETEFPPWVPSFRLTYLNLSNCSLNSISGAVPKFLATQDNLQVIDLSFTKLRGLIPSWLFGNTSNAMRVDLSSNLLSGGFPIPSIPSMIHAIYLSNNNISGSLPPNISSLFPRLVNFSMSNNAIEGNILTSHCSNTSFLRLLDLSNNKLKGDVPSTLFTDCSSLEILKLANNRLHGSMEPLDSNSHIKSSLHVLDVSGNSLYGSIKTWIAALPNLEVLKMPNNSFEGTIPGEMCEMFNMRILDLAHNNLSGSIPNCFVNITPWMENDMERKNSLFNGIDMDLTTKGRTYSYSGGPLSKITTIDLSKNALTGTIPKEIGYLQGLHP